MKDHWGLGRRDRDGKRKPAGLCNCPRRRGLDDLALERSEWIQELLGEENWEMQKMRETCETSGVCNLVSSGAAH